MPGYELPDGPIGDAAFGLAAPFLEVVFEGWSPEQIAALPLHPGAERLAEAGLDDTPLPIGALALFYELRARMHGLVMLELLGHLAPLTGYGEELFRNSMSRLADELAVLRDALPGSVSRSASRPGRTAPHPGAAAPAGCRSPSAGRS
ncbi:hypothetical protein GCM10009609_51560 [Pseudonocardia aurantiaca]